MEPVIIICVIVVVLFAAIMAILSRYRKCPSDKVLVIYGKVGTDKNGQARSARCIHGGAAFIVPIIQSYEYMDLTPISACGTILMLLITMIISNTMIASTI